MKSYIKVFYLLLFILNSSVVFGEADSKMVECDVKEASNSLCSGGSLLFKEDFGGNAVEDPSISTMPVSSMDPSYHQQITAKFGAMGANNYLVTKIGYANGDTSSTAGDPRSQWYIQDDHTYPNDYDRGYFLEIDASSGKVQTFYTATLNDLCAGSTLTFSAYVSNVYTWFQNNWYEKNRGPVMDPNLSFIIYNTANNQELARYETGDIVPDTTLKLKSDWAKSATWHLCAFSFVLPNEVSSVQLSIVNNTVGSIGNDFALDDIEIRLCTPPVIVLAEDTVCVGASTVLTGMFTNDGTFTEPLEYRWLYSATGDLTSQDSWTTIGTNANTLAISSTQLSQSGYYRLAVSSTGGIDLENCRAMSNPVHMVVNSCTLAEPLFCTNGTLLFKEDFGGNAVGDPSISKTPIPQCNLNFKTDGNPKGAGNYVIRKFSYPSHNSWYPRLSDHTHPNDTARGYLMQVDGSATAGQFYTCQIDNLCAEAELYLSVWGMGSCNSSSWTDASLTLVVKNLANIELGRQNITLSQGEGVWAQHGMPFKMPIGETSIIFSVINNTADASGNDFMLDDIEVRLCTPPVTVSIAPTDTVCGGTNVSMVGMFNNDGTFTEPLEYRWLYSATGDLTSQNSWTTIGTNANTLAISSSQLSQTGYYRLAVASAGSIDLENCRAMSDPVHLIVNQCSNFLTLVNDTMIVSACDSTVLMNLLDNDTYTCMFPQVSLLTQPTVLGTIATIRNDSLVYTIVGGHSAIDSIQYSVVCDGDSASAWAHVVVQSNSFITTEIFPNDTICKGEYLLLSGKLTNGGMLELPVMYQWQESSNGMQWTSIDSLGWTSFGSGAGSATVMFPASVGGTTYYRVVIAELGDDSLDYCFVTSSIIPIQVIQPSVDTLQLSGCGLVEYEGQTFLSDSIFVIEMQNPGGCSDELTVDITVKPEPLGETTITDCDSVTYLGVTYFQDTDLTEKFSTDSECDSVFVTHIDVDDCMSGYLVENLIVNKYDWIILCNNTKAKKLLPNYDEINYQWYKDGQKMVGELDDYYTEDRLLFGCFFLRLLIMSDGQAHSFVSETLCVNHEALTISPNPVTLSQYAIINYDFTEEEKVELSVEIYNYLGTKITRFKPTVYPTYLPGGLAQGIYYVKVITGIGRIFGVKLIVN